MGLTKEQIVKHLENQGGEMYSKYLKLSTRGIDFTITQMYLMFFPRRYGKTFMSMSEVMYSGEELDEFIVHFTHNTLRGSRYDCKSFIPQDTDIKNNNQEIDYIRELERFAEEYYPELSVKNINLKTIKFIRKVYI